MRLHEVESRSRLDMAKMRVVAVGEAETLAAKLEAMDGQVARLQSVEAALQRGVLGLLESRRHLEGQIEHRSVPKQDMQRAGEEIERLQAMIDGLGERLRAKEDEMVKLRETMQVADGCDIRTQIATTCVSRGCVGLPRAFASVVTWARARTEGIESLDRQDAT